MKRNFLLISIFCFLGVANVSFAQTNVKINHNGTNGLVIESDGTIKMEGTATVWNDLMVYPDATTKGSSKTPTMTKFASNGGSQGVFIWAFSPSEEQEVYFTIQLPHSYKLETTLYPHVHWTTFSGTPTGTDVVWGLEYTVKQIAGTFGATTLITANSVIGAIGVPSGTMQHIITALPTIPGDGLGISTILVCRLYRAATSGSDTFTGSAGLLGFDIHYEADTEGSRLEFTK